MSPKVTIYGQVDNEPLWVLGVAQPSDESDLNAVSELLRHIADVWESGEGE